jgi:hypothetical protein
MANKPYIGVGRITRIGNPPLICICKGEEEITYTIEQAKIIKKELSKTIIDAEIEIGRR